MNVIITAVFFIALALGVPIAFVMGITAIVVLIILGIPLYLIPQRLFTGMDSFPIMAVPFFILSGDLMNEARITDKIIEFSKLLVGRIRGGLGHVGVVGSMFFAGISGSAVADASALGSVLIPAMEKEKYPKSFAAAVTAAGAVMGPIPAVFAVLPIVMNVSNG